MGGVRHAQRDFLATWLFKQVHVYSTLSTSSIGAPFFPTQAASKEAAKAARGAGRAARIAARDALKGART